MELGTGDAVVKGFRNALHAMPVSRLRPAAGDELNVRQAITRMTPTCWLPKGLGSGCTRAYS